MFLLKYLKTILSLVNTSCPPFSLKPHNSAYEKVSARHSGLGTNLPAVPSKTRHRGAGPARSPACGIRLAAEVARRTLGTSLIKLSRRRAQRERVNKTKSLLLYQGTFVDEISSFYIVELKCAVVKSTVTASSD